MRNSKAWLVAAVAFTIIAITVGCAVGAAGEQQQPVEDCGAYCYPTESTN